MHRKVISSSLWAILALTAVVVGHEANSELQSKAKASATAGTTSTSSCGNEQEFEDLPQLHRLRSAGGARNLPSRGYDVAALYIADGRPQLKANLPDQLIKDIKAQKNKAGVRLLPCCCLCPECDSRRKARDVL
jgi:hypothetical protein